MKRQNKAKKLNRWTGFDVVVMVLTFLSVVVTLYPMIYVFSCSISDPLRVLAGEVVLWPVGFTLQAYELVINDARFIRSLLNSVGYVVAVSVLMLITTVLMAYPLTRKNLKLRKFVTYYLLIPMYFGGGMIPAFIVVTKLGLYNSPLSLILPSCYGIWNIILCKTFMTSLPGELMDSAMIDGCGQFQTLRKVVMPLSKPVLAVILIYTIVGVWNSWFSAAIYTTKETLQPVQLYLRHVLARSASITEEIMKNMPVEEIERLQKAQIGSMQVKYAMIVVTVVPIIAVYPMFQKHFAKGIMLGSLKG